MTPRDFILAARVPQTLAPQSFGWWEIVRKDTSKLIPIFTKWVGFDSMTLLHRLTLATMHKPPGEVVMEDSLRELRRHLPIWLRARGKVLVTGLGLGCVVRGLLASDHVEQVTVIEIDEGILRVVGKEFEGNARVRLIHGDAFTVELGEQFDFAWHDIHAMDDDSPHLDVLHTRLLMRFHRQCAIQGAWQLPRFFKRGAPAWLLR